MPNRHLDLVTAVEQDEQLEAVIESMANLIRTYINIDRVTQLARRPYPIEPWDPARFIAPLAIRRRVRMTVVADPAFSFTYAEHRKLLRAAGTEVVGLDPLVGKPPEAKGYIVPGGFPEEHTDVLSIHSDIHRDLRQAADDGALVYGECTGLF